MKAPSAAGTTHRSASGTITRREALERAARVGAGAYVLGSLPLLARCVPALGQERPNIVFIFSDDHATQAISAYGSRINQTPNIDRIANEGAIFLNSFCTNSICAPSRAVVLTGKHSHINGKIDNGARDPFDMSQPTFNKMLQAAGYETAMIGKWHLRSEPEGFDFWKVLPGQGHYYNPDFRTPAGDEQIEGYVTEIVTDLSLDWLQNGRDGEKPFLLMCQHKAPHRNWMPGPDHLMTYEGIDIPEPPTLLDDYSGRAFPAGDQEMSIRDHMMPAYDLKIKPENPEVPGDIGNLARTYDRMTDAQKADWDAAYDPRNAAFYAANPQGDDLVRWYYQRYIKDYLRCIAGIDDSIGRVLDYLDESGLAENTLVIYSSDQGFYLGEHGWYDKRWMYEESLEMPFVARWPGRIPAGTRVPQLIQNIDYAPTFLELAGETVPADIQGNSLLGLMAGETPSDWRDSIYYHYYEYPEPHRVAPHYGVRTDRHKLIYYYETEEWELFDLVDDPQEMRSVYDAPERAELVATLKAELRRLREHYEDDTGVEFTDG
ncbi:MAG: sulfatase [Gemmatimonadetes bacterium]|nr:sulfatase [Gemmatimonadota bacterium]